MVAGDTVAVGLPRAAAAVFLTAIAPALGSALALLARLPLSLRPRLSLALRAFLPRALWARFLALGRPRGLPRLILPA